MVREHSPGQAGCLAQRPGGTKTLVVGLRYGGAAEAVVPRPGRRGARSEERAIMYNVLSPVE